MTTTARRFYATGSKRRAAINAHCHSCTEKCRCERPADGTGNALMDDAPWCHQGPKAQPPEPESPAARKPRTSKTISAGAIPPSRRLTVNGVSQFCVDECATLTINDGGCPGYPGVVVCGPPFCCTEIFRPKDPRRWEAERTEYGTVWRRLALSTQAKG